VGTRLPNWLDHRTGYRKLIEVLLIEHIPGGARWRYVWGSCLLFVFAVQLLTGLLLMTAYSPSDTTAWSSVYFIQYEMDFGWLIRGLHHFGSQTMVVLLGIHMLQVVIAGAQLPPREVNWWLGLGLLATVLALSLTGYLLPWDQKGYWATQVATNIAGNLPVAGPWLQKIIVGGPVYGHHTLTRFFTLHVGILPPLVILLTIAHLTVFRRHGVTTRLAPVTEDPKGAPLPSKGDGWFWPDQAFRDMVVSMLIFGVMLGLVVWGHGHKIDPPAASSGNEQASAAPTFYDRVAHAGRDGRGANLDAPADPSRPYPARPEWYFLFLFQLLKYFEGENEIIGTVIIPNGVLILLALLPLLGYGWMRPVGRVAGVVVVGGLLVGVAILTERAFAADRADTEPAQKFREQQETAELLAARAINLAAHGIPVEGPTLLLRRDPQTQGEERFKQYCAVCHNHGNDFQSDKATASDLAGFGSREWITGLLREPRSPHYFGHTSLDTMSKWVERTRKSAKRDGKEQELDADFDKVATWLAGHPRGDAPEASDPSPAAQGYRVYEERCASCHTYKGSGERKGPDFTGYGDETWVRLMVMSPASHLRYGIRNSMPAFHDLEGATAEIARAELEQTREFLAKDIKDDDPQAAAQKTQLDTATRIVNLSAIDRELIIRWLLNDDRIVFGGEPISAAPR
jgi:ubiquinol-cytochrome c reductase cytochrome b subunit